jgi:GxxExxY protein
MIHEELSREIIGAAMVVLNELKPGLDEKLYERVMIIELKHRRHRVLVQTSFPVPYRGELIGNLIPDVIVDDAVIVDPKVVSCFTETHVAQMIGYLNITRLDLALLINFKNPAWNGNACCVLRNLTHKILLTFMPKPSYLCNPWFFYGVPRSIP